MGFKKLKAARRKMEYFSREFGFHQPYKVLLDGNFIHATLNANIANLDATLSKLLGGKVRLFVSGCVHRELSGLGQDFEPTRAHARSFAKHKCEHGKGTMACDCLQSIVGGGNPDHWCVATQDKELYKDLKEAVGVPCIFATANGLDMAEPVGMKAQVQAWQASGPAMPEHERLSLASQGLPLKGPKKKERSKFRLNKAKGPNPLAVKKPKQKVQVQRQPVGQKHKRTRVRRRHNTKATPSEAKEQ